MYQKRPFLSWQLREEFHGNRTYLVTIVETYDSAPSWLSEDRDTFAAEPGPVGVALPALTTTFSRRDSQVQVTEKSALKPLRSALALPTRSAPKIPCYNTTAGRSLPAERRRGMRTAGRTENLHGEEAHMTPGRESFSAEAAELLLLWARKAAPHYGPSGSMDLDRLMFPNADGPSFYNQLAHYALLLLSEGVVPGARPEEAAHFRELALNNIRYMLDITDADFLTPHYSRGRDWGKIICEWQYNFLFRSAKIIQERSLGAPGFRSELDRVVLGGTGKLRDGMRGAAATKFPGNHFTWTALLAYEVGRHYGRRDLAADGEKAFAADILPYQEAHGGWPEGGIVVTYALVTAHAVSDYAELSGDAAARAAIAKALPFFQFLTFPTAPMPSWPTPARGTTPFP